MYISITFYLSTHYWKISLIWNLFPLILAENPHVFRNWKKVFKIFPDSPGRWEPCKTGPNGSINLTETEL